MKKKPRALEGLKIGNSDYPLEDTAPLSGPLQGMKICVVGAGFVGTVAAAGFARFGHQVVCVEKDQNRLSLLRSGQLPYFERDLEELVRRELASGRLVFDSDLEKSVEGKKAVFLTVGTPSSSGGRADLSALQEVISALSRKMKSGQILVLKSTVPVGTAEIIKKYFSQNGKRSEIEVINNPEFLREGNAVFDFFNPPRIVIGGNSGEAIETISHIYKMGMTKSVPIYTTDNRTAEMIKYASNVFLATKVGFVNELARLCDSVGVNALEVARAIGADPRIGHQFLEPGPGWGGSCLPKDLQEFIGLADSLGVSLFIPRAVSEANLYQFEHIYLKVKNLVENIAGARIGVLGLTFKANTSDLRQSPAIPIITKLLDNGAEVTAYDPAADDEAKSLLPDIIRVDDPYKTAEGADCMLILTEWSDFQLLDWNRISEIMKSKNIVDARNILPPELLKRYGFNYASIGQN
ncbi:MAG: UDP-glucose/GDP-mannose dehydrogenase family protein [Candidatus Zixiibacteriota bacterium]|nr:MAG: UDP-glucose/GDP-mannose dehydrogenase family protein [candidate division Zixibacteria bacterium]